MDLTAVFIIGFIVLGIYKLFELFVRKSERMALIEKLPVLLNTNEVGKLITFPEISFMKQNYGSWSLRSSLLFVGVGLGCLLAFWVQYCYIDISKYIDLSLYKNNDWQARNEIAHIRFVLYFSFIAICGGISLFIAYLIERKQSKKQEN